MVNFTKWILIAAGLVGLGLFTQEAAATGLTGTLQRTGLSGMAIGSGAAAAGSGIGSGIGGFFKGVLSPFWEIRNIVRGFMNLGSATPWLDDTSESGGGTDSSTGEGGGINPEPLSIVQGSPDVYTGQGFTITGGSEGSVWTFLPTAEATMEQSEIIDGGGSANNVSGGGGSGANLSSLGSQTASGGGFGAAN